MKRKLKFIAMGLIGTTLLLLIILVVHIATAKPIKYDNATMQISRIDFQEPLDSLKIKEIHRNLKSIPGFISDSYNIKNNVVVFFHDNKIADSKKIVDQLIQKGNYKATRYVLPKGMEAKQVCPVIEQGSFSYHFSKGIQRIFN
jgi:copper chaperone CopZ